MQLRYSTEEILADPSFARLNSFGARRLHGGYDAPPELKASSIDLAQV